MLFDTAAWIEFFQGTDTGRIVEEKIIAGENFTSIVTFAEIVNWCFRTGIEDKSEYYLGIVKKGSQILHLNELISINAGKLNYERKKGGRKWGMIDSIIVATAQTYGLKILTKDNAFRDLPDAQVL